MSEDSFYLADGDAWLSTTKTRGPWSPKHQHAGPPCALLARAMEQVVGEGFRFVRVNVEIPRPVPIERLYATAKIVRSGRSVRYASAELKDEAGKLLMQATGVAIRETTLELPAYSEYDNASVLPVAESADFEFPFFFPDLDGYNLAMEKRCGGGEFMSGKCAVWMRMRVPLIAGETPSPLQRVMTAADSGSGVSMALDPKEYTFLNPDLTVYLRRYPVGEWVCLDGITVPDESGIGLASTGLRDKQGLIGQGLQSLLINKRE